MARASRAARASTITSTPKAKTTTQTVRINGVRTKITTKAGRVTSTPALPLEWELQAAQVRRLKRMPEYGKQFLVAGDMNASKRGPTAQAQAVATGMTSGEPDLRIYLIGGRLGLIENKVGKGRLSIAQRDRHAALAQIGHIVEVISADNEQDAADQAVTLVKGWLVANTDKPSPPAN